MKSSENIVFKRIAFVLIILLGIVTVLVSFAGCNRLIVGDKNAVGIKIQSNPYKMQYNRGETFDISGLTIFEVYESGAEIIITDYTTTPAAGEILNEAGYFPVTVEKIEIKPKVKKHFQATFYIQVN